jgi:iron complex outermembrane receptor protein
MRVSRSVFFLAAMLASVAAWTEPDAANLSTAGSRAAPESDVEEVIVTARRREEALKDVPIAVTALTGDALAQQQINTVKDIAAYAPGLNINSDSAGRSFVSIRGIGTTLINTVQPGVGIFLDGIYQPDTSYLNSPIVDVERIEVLRGPQGTLFGNNTLGGAINVITRQPTDSFEGRVSGAYAGTDHYYSAAASLSGPIVPGVLQGRIAVSDHSQNGFGHNLVAGSYANPLGDRSVNTTLRFEPADFATVTVRGYYNRVFGGSTAYAHVAGPTDYEEDIATNENSTVLIYYKGANIKGVFDLKSLDTTVTAVAAYDRRTSTTQGDGDFSAVDFLRAWGNEVLQTRTGELKFDTSYNEHLSSLIGVFASHETTTGNSTTTLVPFGLVVPAFATSENKTDAVYGTAFWKFLENFELAAGLRFDHQTLATSTDTTAGDYKANEWEPRLTLTRHWTPNLMTYASISRGFRGGGQNPPGSPNLIYKGDSVVTSEIGSKFSTLDHRLLIDANVFFNNYAHFIGQNSLAPSAGGGFVAINLNSGHVKSYGAEIEAHFTATRQLRFDGGFTYLHARITNQSEYIETTGFALASDRVLFTPDWNYNLDGIYSMPVRDGRDTLELMLVAVGKGNRIGSSLSPTVAPELSAYSLINTSISYRLARAEIALFATNLFDKKYFESYIDSSSLIRAGLPPPLASDLGLEGDRRRVGIRAKYQF